MHRGVSSGRFLVNAPWAECACPERVGRRRVRFMPVMQRRWKPIDDGWPDLHLAFFPDDCGPRLVRRFLDDSAWLPFEYALTRIAHGTGDLSIKKA